MRIRDVKTAGRVLAIAAVAATAPAAVVFGVETAPPSIVLNAAEEQAVSATLDALSRGVEKQDLALLATVFHDDVSYGHSTGIVQTKAEVIEVYRTRKTDSLKFNDRMVRVIGTTALVRAEMVSSRYREDSPDRLTHSVSRVLWVLVKGKGPHGWQIVARQNFRSE